MYSRICVLGILIGVFILNGNIVFSQPQNKVEVLKLYDIAIKKYLLPSDDHSVSILYLEKPSFEPEYSIRIIEFKDSVKLEGDFFKESYWYQLYRHFKQYQNAEFEPEVEHYSVLVSKSFNAKMKSVFFQTMESKVSYPSTPNGLTVTAVDGTNYLFRLINGQNLSLELHEPKSNSLAFKTAAICKEIATSLKINHFDEGKIIEKINETGY